ncbi:hypothetical protein [Clostridium hydrogeniformans]|uniref:hypothetical protein n=1 Tax=Clostridium hydrogeniformans TaxID=349933 RepID=UPI000488726E|nr:hypothetical protein [Clostridium hydrogeniformans]
MEVKIYLKGQNAPITYMGDRIDVLDFKMNGVDYKQIRTFKKGFSKSELIETKAITRIYEME